MVWMIGLEVKLICFYRTEMIVWDKELKLCGSIDMMYINEFVKLNYMIEKDVKK